MKEKLIRTLLSLALLAVLLGHVLHAYQLPFVGALERLLYDTKVNLTMPGTVDDRIVILDIDEKSLAEVGRWPWSRDKMADLINKLFDHYHVRQVGFDVVMAEPDESSGLNVLVKLGQTDLRSNSQYHSAFKKIQPQLDYDSRFAKAIAGRPVILGYYLSNQDHPVGAIPAPVLDERAFEGRSIPFHTYSSYGGNLPALQKAAMGGGHFSPIVDIDGSVRRVPMLAKHNNAYYEAFSLAMVRTLLGNPPIVPVFGEEDAGSAYAAVEWLDLPTSQGTLSIPVDDRLTALVPYRGPERSFPYLSIADVLADRVKPEQLAGRVVLVGTTAPGLRDQRTTPVGSVYAGVEVHANLISGMLDGTIKLKPMYSNAVEFLLLLTVGGIMIFLFPWRSPLWATVATTIALLTVVAVNLGFWHYMNHVVPLATSLLLVGGLYVLSMSYGYFFESKTKKQFTELFGQYVPPELVEEMSRSPESYNMAGRRAELSVLFSDIRGFTSFSEGMEPDQLANLMNEYLSAMTLVVRKHRGTLDKYIGDAIMAFWGAPVADADHARNAVLTALEMQQALVDLNKTLSAKGAPEIKIGVGVNTGLMTVGDMGSSIRKAYTVMGDAVNLGSRLEGITKQYGVGIMVGEETRKAIKDIVFRELDLVQVKGKEEPVAIYEPLGIDGQLDQACLDELDRWHRALADYRQQRWEEAESAILQLLHATPDCMLYQIYLERIRHLRENPPSPDWSGVTKFDTK